MADGLNNTKSSGSGVGAGIALAALPALGGVASTLLSNSANADAARYATDYDYKKWREYVKEIDPKTQVAKLRAAGINPAIAMGNGAIDSGNPSSPQNAANVPNYDFSPIAQGINSSVELYQQRRLQDAQISQMDAVTQNQQIRNLTQLRRDLMEYAKMANDASKSEAERDYAKKMVDFTEKQINWYDKQAGAEIDKLKSEELLNNATRVVQEQVAESTRLENAFRKATNPVRAQQMLADVVLTAAQSALANAESYQIYELTPAQKSAIANEVIHMVNQDAATFEQLGINLQQLGLAKGHANMDYLSDWLDPILKTLSIGGGLYLGTRSGYKAAFKGQGPRPQVGFRAYQYKK